LPPVFLVALPPVLGPLLRSLLLAICANPPIRISLEAILRRRMRQGGDASSEIFRRARN
jgi:hypothetical protein